MSSRTSARRTTLHAAAAGTTIAILAVLVLAADQFTKYLALENLPEKQAVPVLGDALQLFLTFNPGAAFSLGEGVTWVFTLVLMAAALVIVFLAVSRVRTRSWSIVLGLLLGGILGNLTDRLLRPPGFLTGHVVDFIHTPWLWLGFPSAIYNVADMFIVTMMISVALLVLLGIRFDGSREKDDTEQAPAATADPDSAP